MSNKYYFPGFFPCLFRCNKENIEPGVKRKTALTTIFMVLMADLMVIFILMSSFPVEAQNIEQRIEPVIVLGVDLPGLTDIPIDEIWLYAYDDGEWKQIPFQIDERNHQNGSYFFDAVDGTLNSNDEIVFMPFDAGAVAPSTSWVPSTGSQRYEVRITDTIDSSMKYVYIYTSSNLVKEFVQDYVDYDSINHVIFATDYTVGFDNVNFGIMDEIRLTAPGGDNSDILDRSKYRFQRPTIPIPSQYHENDFTDNLIGYKDGPVRVIRLATQEKENDDFFLKINSTLYAYKSSIYIEKAMSTNTSVDWLRVSLDFLNKSTPMTYYDSNSNELIIDGSPESPTSSEVQTWAEVTGSNGTIVIMENFLELGGSQSLYYTDNKNSDDMPESENGEYGDFGIFIQNPEIDSTKIYSSYYFLPSNLGNVGTTYLNHSNNPINTTATIQYIDPTPPPDIRDLTAYPSSQEIEGYVNISATIEDNLGELYGAWINITNPNGNSIWNESMNYDSNTNRYYHNRSYDVLGAYSLEIWANDTSGNWNSLSGQFAMQDTTLPTITEVTSLPDPQEVNGQVNISAVITDFEVNGAWVSLTAPNGYSIGNFTMGYELNTNRYYYQRAYNNVGTYQFIIWANDVSGNWNSYSGQFLIQDMTTPTASAGSDQSVNKDTIVAFDGSGSSDNLEIVNYTWTFTDLTLKTLYGVDPTYIFNNVGSFEVTLKVTDAAGNLDSDSMWVNVSQVITTGSISGTVIDRDGNPVEGATIRLISTIYENTTTSNVTGFYIFQNVPAGIYDLEVKKNDYETETINQVTIQAGQDRLNENFALEKITEEGAENYLWVVLLIVIVLVIILVLFLPKIMPKLRKEKEREKVIPQEIYREEPIELAEVEERVEEEPIELPTTAMAETVSAQSYEDYEDYEDYEGYESSPDLLEGIEVEEREPEPEETLTPEDLGGLSPDIIDIERELEELLKEEPKPAQPKEELKDELEALSEEIDKILNETEDKDLEGKNKKD